MHHPPLRSVDARHGRADRRDGHRRARTRARCSASSSLVAPPSPWATRWSLSPPSARPLSATDLYQVLETSDVPAGVVNIVTGARDALAKVLAEHDDVDALWYFGADDRRGGARGGASAAT